MASDMAVALARATLDGHTYFAHNCNRPRGEVHALVRTVGRDHAPGEKVSATHVSLPQARRTIGVLAGRSGNAPGYQHGVNEKGVAVGCTPIRTRLLEDGPCLTGPDLVRLALERASTALGAVETVTDLIGRYGGARCIAEVNGCRSVAQKQHLELTRVRFTRCRVAAEIGRDAPDQNGVNPASTQDRFELRCLEAANMRLRENDIAGLDGDFGVKCGRWRPVVDHPLCHWRYRLSQDAHI